MSKSHLGRIVKRQRFLLSPCTQSSTITRFWLPTTLAVFVVPLQLTSQFSSASSSTIRPPDPSLVPFASSDDRYALSPVHEFLHTDHRLLLDPEGLSFFFIVVGTDCRRGERQARQRPQATQQQKWEGRVMWGAGWWVVGRMGCREMERGREERKREERKVAEEVAFLP